MFFLPRHVESAITGPEETKNPAGQGLRLIQIRIATPSLEKSCQPFKTIRRKRESPIRVRERQATLDLHAQ
jgi:hypothetical protein